jgi:hypothetical protein
MILGIKKIVRKSFSEQIKNYRNSEIKKYGVIASKIGHKLC